MRFGNCMVKASRRCRDCDDRNKVEEKLQWRGCPVGFVGAAESKDALMADLPAPSVIVKGRLGGSAITVAAVNALASRKE